MCLIKEIKNIENQLKINNEQLSYLLKQFYLNAENENIDICAELIEKYKKLSNEQKILLDKLESFSIFLKGINNR